MCLTHALLLLLNTDRTLIDANTRPHVTVCFLQNKWRPETKDQTGPCIQEVVPPTLEVQVEDAALAEGNRIIQACKQLKHKDGEKTNRKGIRASQHWSPTMLCSSDYKLLIIPHA